MAEDKGKEEEKFDFTPEGEGYISLAEARVLAVRTAVESPGNYGRQYRGVAMVFEAVESTETDDHYNITLSFRPQGSFDGTPGQEQFVIGQDGAIAVRQVLSSIIRKGGGFPVIPVAIGLVVVGIIAAVGAVFVLMGSGGDSVPIAAVPPTETPAPTETLAPTQPPTPTQPPAPTGTLAPPAPTFTPMPTYTPYPTPTPRPTYTPVPSPIPRPTPTFTPRATYRPTATAPPSSSANVQTPCYPAADATWVTAWIDGEQVAATLVSGGEYYLLLEPPVGGSFIGKLVRFKISGMEAQQTAPWVQGGGDILNLTVEAGSARQGIPTPLSLGPNQFGNWSIGVLAQRPPPHIFVGTVSIC